MLPGLPVAPLVLRNLPKVETVDRRASPVADLAVNFERAAEVFPGGIVLAAVDSDATEIAVTGRGRVSIPEIPGDLQGFPAALLGRVQVPEVVLGNTQIHQRARPATFVTDLPFRFETPLEELPGTVVGVPAEGDRTQVVEDADLQLSVTGSAEYLERLFGALAGPVQLPLTQQYRPEVL